MGDLLKNALFFIFNYKAYRAREKKGQKIGWRDIFWTPAHKHAIYASLIFTLVIIIIYHATRNVVRENKTISKGGKITALLNDYRHHMSYYPESLDQVLRSPLETDLQIDGWGNEFRYQLDIDKQTFTLISPGKDHMLNSDDDIVFN